MHIKNETFIESNVSNDTENTEGKLTEERKKFSVFYCYSAKSHMK